MTMDYVETHLIGWNHISLIEINLYIKDNSSEYTKLNFGVPQGSVLGPLFSVIIQNLLEPLQQNII